MQQNASTTGTTNRTARSSGATTSSACPTGSIAADVAIQDSRKTVGAHGFSTTGEYTAASVGSSN